MPVVIMKMPDEETQEQQWLADIRDGKVGAFSHIVQLYQRMIQSLTLRMSGSPSDAEDLAQEIFLRAYWELPSFRGDAKFSSWLYRIGINTCLNWQKSRQRRERAHEDFARAVPAPTRRHDLADRIQDALLQLPPPQRTAIILTVYDGLTHLEAARALGCSETTVSWRVFRARRQLKALLQGTDSPAPPPSRSPASASPAARASG